MTQLISVESPYNSIYPWLQRRNIQYAIQCNTHAASLGDVTWTPHIVNTQFVKFGFNGYVSDSLSTFLFTPKGLKLDKYFIGRDETLKRTNEIRQTKIDKVVCYTDYGISNGMQGAIEAAKKANVPIEYRKLPKDMKKDIFGESVQSTLLPVVKSITTFSLSFYGLKCLLKRFKP